MVDDLIYQPDQAKGFCEHVEARIVITILLEKIIRTGGIPADEEAVRQLHSFPFPATTMAGLTRWKEAIHFDDLPTALLHFPREQGQEFAERSI